MEEKSKDNNYCWIIVIMMTTPAEKKGKLKRQILNAARLPRWEPTFGILIGGYFILCQSDICNFGDPSQRLVKF